MTNFATEWVNMLYNFNRKRYYKLGDRDGYLELVSSKVLIFAAKLIGIMDDFNYRRRRKMGKVDRGQMTTRIAWVLIFIFIIPACGLIFVAFIITLILDSIFK